MGQLVREKYGESQVFAVGFGSYQGSVIAASQWGAPMQDMEVPPAREGSWEALLQEAGDFDKIIFSKDVQEEPSLQQPWMHRAIGVVYSIIRKEKNMEIMYPASFPGGTMLLSSCLKRKRIPGACKMG